MERETRLLPKTDMPTTVKNHLRDLVGKGEIKSISTSGLPLGLSRNETSYFIAPKDSRSEEEARKTINSAIEVEGLIPERIRYFKEGENTNLLNGIAEAFFIEEGKEIMISAFLNVEYLDLVTERALLEYEADKTNNEIVKEDFLNQIQEIDERLSELQT